MDTKGLHPAAKRFGHALDRFGRVWNGYEVRGLQAIPADRPVLLVAYHGFFPVDGWYLTARYWLETGRVIRSLGDRWLFQMPGLSRFLRHVGSVPGNRKDAVRLLREGNTVFVSPGGVREALAGPRDHYNVLWGKRLGFAHVALEAGVDLVPVFTENIEEVYRAPGSSTAPFRWLYERTRWPLVPIVGMGMLPWPVKLRTWVGERVQHDPRDTPEQLRDRARMALQTLMDRHQGPPPRLARGLWARLAQQAEQDVMPATRPGSQSR
jgi:1-acyl-sn-glycerol-3-phosphate acyltransferase